MKIENVLSLYIELIAKILKRIRLRIKNGEFEISFDRQVEASIDERIRKIDVARANLVEGLSAIDELRKSAEDNKKEVKAALEQLAMLEQDKADLQEKLDSVRQVISRDVQAFREVAGVPSPSGIRRERVIGFVGGVVASIVASGIIYGVAKIIQNFEKITNWFT